MLLQLMVVNGFEKGRWTVQLLKQFTEELWDPTGNDDQSKEKNK
jgi:hypothetical protein